MKNPLLQQAKEAKLEESEKEIRIVEDVNSCVLIHVYAAIWKKKKKSQMIYLQVKNLFDSELI